MDRSHFDELDRKQQRQEEQYEYPYHYVPTVDEGFSQTQHWSWGYRYLGGIQVVLNELDDLAFDSLIDIGCGDGRFLREVNRMPKYADKRLLGIDYSSNAVDIANAMNPDIEYRALNILEDDIGETFDVATLIEVLEHIDPAELPKFVDEVTRLITGGGTMVLTVPHENKSLNEKHYQHFSRDDLAELLEERFQSVQYIPFDEDSKLLTVVHLLLGGSGKNVVVTNERLNEWFFRIYLRRYLYAPDESYCNRIAAVCTKS